MKDQRREEESWQKNGMKEETVNTNSFLPRFVNFESSSHGMVPFKSRSEKSRTSVDVVYKRLYYFERNTKVAVYCDCEKKMRSIQHIYSWYSKEGNVVPQ